MVEADSKPEDQTPVGPWLAGARAGSPEHLVLETQVRSGLELDGEVVCVLDPQTWQQRRTLPGER